MDFARKNFAKFALFSQYQEMKSTRNLSSVLQRIWTLFCAMFSPTAKLYLCKIHFVVVFEINKSKKCFIRIMYKSKIIDCRRHLIHHLSLLETLVLQFRWFIFSYLGWRWLYQWYRRICLLKRFGLGSSTMGVRHKPCYG